MAHSHYPTPRSRLINCVQAQRKFSSVSVSEQYEHFNTIPIIGQCQYIITHTVLTGSQRRIGVFVCVSVCVCVCVRAREGLHVLWLNSIAGDRLEYGLGFRFMSYTEIGSRDLSLSLFTSGLESKSNSVPKSVSVNESSNGVLRRISFKQSWHI